MFMTHCKYETQQLHYTLQFQIIISTFCYSGKYLLTPKGGLRINFAFLDAIASLGLPPVSESHSFDVLWVSHLFEKIVRQ